MSAQKPVKQHSCAGCHVGKPDPRWERIEPDPRTPFVAHALHIHTSRWVEASLFPTLEQAQAYCDRMNRTCTSHRTFFATAHGTDPASSRPA